MIIFANVRKSIDCKGFILLNVHPALKCDNNVGKFGGTSKTKNAS